MFLRNSGALQFFVSKECLTAGDYNDMLEQGIFGQPTEIPLVEVNAESDKLSGNIFCGLIDKLPDGLDFLIGIKEVMPLHVSVVMRARTDTSKRNSVVTSQADKNDSDKIVNLNLMHTGADVIIR